MAAEVPNTELEEQLKDIGTRLQEAPDDSQGLLKLLDVSLLSHLFFNLVSLSFSVIVVVTVVYGVWRIDWIGALGLFGHCFS
jgi:hypothetical protein